MARFKFSEVQAQAILDMRLQRLTNLEREKILEEYRQTLKLIADLEEILASPFKLMNLIKEELLALKKTYADKRRTNIVDEEAELQIEDLIPDEDALITISHTGYIKRIPASTYRVQRRGGKGRRGMTTTPPTSPSTPCRLQPQLPADLHRPGQGALAEGLQHSRSGHRRQGPPRRQPGQDGSGEKIADIIPVKEFSENEYVVLATAAGIIKKTPLSEFSNHAAPASSPRPSARRTA